MVLEQITFEMLHLSKVAFYQKTRFLIKSTPCCVERPGLLAAEYLNIFNGKYSKRFTVQEQRQNLQSQGGVSALFVKSLKIANNEARLVLL